MKEREEGRWEKGEGEGGRERERGERKSSEVMTGINHSASCWTSAFWVSGSAERGRNGDS